MGYHSYEGTNQSDIRVLIPLYTAASWFLLREIVQAVCLFSLGLFSEVVLVAVFFNFLGQRMQFT
jgi:hypothetical protein